MIGYDVDGVLAVKPPMPDMKWGRMNGEQRRARQQQLLDWYSNCDPILQPDEPFVAISARKENPETRLATEIWIQRHQPNCRAIYLLPISRSIENVVAFKAAVIRDLELTDFTEDNKKILRGLAKEDLSTRLWYFDHTLPEPTRFEP